MREITRSRSMSWSWGAGLTTVGTGCAVTCMFSSYSFTVPGEVSSHALEQGVFLLL